MKMRNFILSLFAITCIATSAMAQDIEGGIFIGTTQYQGDLTKKQITISETKPSVGILGRYYFGPRINLKGSAYYGWIEGGDDNYDDIFARKLRNLSFTSSVFDLSGQVEINILPFISNSKRYRFAPYVFGGVALYHFNPKAKLDGNTYALQPLGTEGQNLPGSSDGPYSRWQGSIPYGVGIKYSLGNFWNLGFELGQRKIFTDYLDDVSTTYPNLTELKNQNADAARLSNRTPEVQNVDPKYAAQDRSGVQRGNDKKLDMYVFAGFTITKTIRRFSCTNF